MNLTPCTCSILKTLQHQNCRINIICSVCCFTGLDLELDFLKLIETPVDIKESSDPDCDVPDPGTDEETEQDMEGKVL